VNVPRDSLSDPLSFKKKLFTVVVFTKISTKRFFRDRLALFFGILFPLIFLFVFGSIFGKAGNSVTFNVGMINHSNRPIASQFIHEATASKIIKIDPTVTTLSAAETKMTRGQLDATLVLPSNYGAVGTNKVPTGQVVVYYTENNAQAGETLVAILQSQFQSSNIKYIQGSSPFSATSKEINTKSLTQFDYTFSGLLGFSIVGLGIFGPVNVFPELKKQGILRRLHTTPIRVWQYFTSTMASQAIIGLISLAIMFIAAISIFHLKVVGNYLEIIVFLVFSIVMILGIGLAIGGWAKNERQAAPLANIIVFPMLFLSGTFFPRYAMPLWLQHATTYLPLTPVIDGVRLLATEGQHLTQIGPQLGIMAIWTIVIYAIAFRVFRWE
jgi:ABC-2 type transport system permease protein